MKPHVVILVLLALFAAMVFTGFQCGSANVTSAKLYEQRQDWVDAEKAYEKEVATNPTNAEAWYLLGHVRYFIPKYKEMMQAFDTALSLPDGNKFAADIAKTKLSAWGQSLNQAVGYFNKSISATPDSATLLRQKAVDAYKAALMINPDSAITYQNLAVAYHALKEYDNEIATLKEGLKHTANPDMQTSLVNAYIMKAQEADAKNDTTAAKQDYNDAITAMNDAIKAKPNDPDLLRTMIDLYVRTGRAKEAMPYMEAAIKNAPAGDTTAKVYQYNMGVLLLQTDEIEPAIQHFDAALKLDPSYEPALQNMAVAQMKLGDKMKKEAQAKESKDKSYIQHFKDAAGYFEKLINLNDQTKNNPDYWDYLGSAYANANMIKEANAAIKKADELKKGK